jgi:peptide/nickel transport system permease protein
MTDTDTITTPAVKKPVGYFRAAVQMGRTKFGLALVGIIVAIAAFGPYFAPYGAGEGVGNGTPAQLPVTPEPGRPYVLLGSDKLGQDVWSRFLLGGREILVMALIATALALVIGAFVGMYAGYSKGMADTVLMRTMDIMIAFPSLSSYWWCSARSSAPTG